MSGESATVRPPAGEIGTRRAARRADALGDDCRKSVTIGALPYRISVRLRLDGDVDK